jgi:predicted phosphoribosyltransferase
MEGKDSFRNREDAGQRLTEELVGYRDEDLVVLALPRGGLPVGYEISRSLRASLNVFIARKLGAPGQPEFGIGAVAQKLKTLRSEVNELVCLETPSDLMTIDLLYEDFSQVPDEEVIVLLKRARREQDERGATSPEGRA